MTKLIYEDKKEIIRLYFEENISCIKIAIRFHVSKKVTQTLIEKYKEDKDSEIKTKIKVDMDI